VNTYPYFNIFAPNTTIECEDMADLHRFENVIADRIKPDMNLEARERWNARTKLRDELRPRGINTMPTDIQLQAMEDPYERIETARSRGYTFPAGQAQGKTRDLIKFLHEEFNLALGFTYTATIRNIGQAVIGTVDAELWYHGGGRDRSFDIGTPVQRINTKPRLTRLE
jgi:hypothetical protein